MRKLLKVALAGALGMVALVLAAGGAGTAAEDKTVDTSTIMKKSFKDKNNYQTAIPAAAKGGKWEDATKLAKEWAELGAALAKNKPNKGEAKAWDSQCAKFADSTKAVLKACEDKDAKAVEKNAKAFNCGSCHKAHR